MATIFGKAQQTTSVNRTSEGNQKQLRTFRDGALVGCDWITALVLEGRVHGINSGTGTTPVPTNPVYGDALQDIYVYVPAGTVIIPLYVGIEVEDSEPAAVVDIFAAYSANGDGAVTATPLTIYNYKTLASPASACTASETVTSGGTTHLGGEDFLEFWRPYSGFMADAVAGSIAHLGSGRYSAHHMEWSARQFVPPIIGSADQDCALSVFVGLSTGAVTPDAYVTCVWAELPASAFA